MKKLLLKEMEGNLTWREKIIIQILAKTFYKVYKLGIMRGYNWSNTKVR